MFIHILILLLIIVLFIYACTRKKSDVSAGNIDECDGVPDTLGHRIRDLYKTDREIFDIYFKTYLTRTTKVPDEVVDYMVKHIDDMSDRELLGYLIDKSGKIEGHGCCYSKKVEKTAKDIIKKFRSMSADDTEGLNSYLDIGAVSSAHFDIIADEFGMDKSKCYGVNVDSDNPSALKYGQESNPRIIIYDGIDIPDIIGQPFDLVTIISVLHHVPQDALKELVKSIAARCSKYLLIKENDLLDEKSQTYFIWQHLVFWRSLEMRSYTRCDITSKKLAEMLSPYFELVAAESMGVFTRATWCLFKKNENLQAEKQ